MPKVLIISTQFDTGGQGERIANVFRRLDTDWEVNSICQRSSYLQFPIDIPWEWGQEFYDKADIIHYKVDTTGYDIFSQGRPPKPSVLHHQGSQLRGRSETARADNERTGVKIEFVSTVDLILDAPDAHWIPAPLDLKDTEKYLAPRGLSWTIIHSPTDREIKGTEAIVAAVNSLSKRYDISLDLIEKKPWRVCLSRKGQGNVSIDQLKLGYGTNAVESWALRHPVICGVENPEVKGIMREFWAELPFFEATEGNIEQKIEELYLDDNLRKEYSERGYEHALRYHDDVKVAKTLINLWSSIL